MAHDYERTRRKLERTEAQLLKAIEMRRKLEAQLKALREQEKIDRLCSRGEMLETYLREPELLTNAEIDSLLETAFGMDAVQAQLAELLNAKHGQNATMAEAESDLHPGRDAGGVSAAAAAPDG